MTRRSSPRGIVIQLSVPQQRVLRIVQALQKAFGQPHLPHQWWAINHIYNTHYHDHGNRGVNINRTARVLVRHGLLYKPEYSNEYALTRKGRAFDCPNVPPLEIVVREAE